MAIDQALIDYFRPAIGWPALALDGELSETRGYFRFGADIPCYGRRCLGNDGEPIQAGDVDVLDRVRLEKGRCVVPFDPTEIGDNFRLERYVPKQPAGGLSINSHKLIRAGYYLLRPLLPVSIRKYLQRLSLRGWEEKTFPTWPVDRTVDRIFEQLLLLLMKASGEKKIPFIWFWPDGKLGCVVMTHDVETARGLAFCPALMSLDESYGIKSSFQLIPGSRYLVTPEMVEEVRRGGFEANVHDWNHDGSLFSNQEVFLERAEKINRFAAEHRIEGFRSGALYRNVEWYNAFAIAYDMSVPNTGHLDPQPGGCCTVMPYFIGGILEIPVTTIQDYSLWHILQDYSIDIWKRQLDLILAGSGMASFIVHPDYIIERRARSIYSKLLRHLSQLQAERNIWMALPGQVNRWWRQRSQMRLVRAAEGWKVEGAGHEQARIAYANSDGHHLRYTLE